jgi:hypothetical protein
MELFLSTPVPQSGRQTGHINDPTYSCGESGGIRERKFGAERVAKDNPFRVLPVRPQLFEINKPAFDRVWRTARRSPAASLFVAMHLNKVVNHVSHGLKLVGAARSAMQQDQGLTLPLRGCPKACSIGLNVLLTDGPFHCPIWISPLLAFAHFQEVDRHGPNLSFSARQDSSYYAAARTWPGPYSGLVTAPGKRWITLRLSSRYCQLTPPSPKTRQVWIGL